jgi:damage-control phosphatase, subfamily I
MKVLPRCRDCLKDLARQVVTLSEGDERLLDLSISLIEGLFSADCSPTLISNRLLKYVRQNTAVDDPFADLKEIEFQRATDSAKRLKGFFPATLQGALQSSAFGNGGDFFVEHSYDVNSFTLGGDVANIEARVYNSSKILVLGDNVGDFVFDLPLVKLLERHGKKVFYAVKARPVQNDMSMHDVERFGAREMDGALVSTGTDEVGIRREEMSGVIRECWENGSLVIAKGMGNYETISEFHEERPVVYVMKVKCGSVAETLGRKIGEYIAIAGGDHG